jgi:hypothetical protein
MDNFRPCPSASQSEDGRRPTQSDYSRSSSKDAATSGVTDCPAIAADGRPAPSLRVAWAAEKFSWHKDRLIAKTVSNFPRHARSISLSVSEVDLRSGHSQAGRDRQRPSQWARSSGAACLFGLPHVPRDKQNSPLEPLPTSPRAGLDSAAGFRPEALASSQSENTPSGPKNSNPLDEVADV